MSNTPIPPNKPGGSSNGQSAPAPAQEASLTGYTPPAGEDEIVEELAEEIVDDVIEDAVVAPVQAPPPPAPVATPAPVVRAASPVPPSTPAAPIAPPAPVARVATPAPVTPPVPPAPPAGPSRADILLDSLAAEEYRRTSVAASAPIAPVAPAAPISSAQPVEPRVTYTTTPPPPSSGAGDAAPSEIVEDEVIEDAVDLGTAPAAVAPTPPPADLHVDLDEFSTAVDTAPKAPRPRTAMPKNVAPPSSLQSTSIPVLITVGLLLLGPGVWSVLILLGKTEIPGGEREDAKKMASLFWICLPMGLLLITGALYFLVQVRDEAKARKERHDFALAKIAAAETARVQAEQAVLQQQQAAAAAAAQAQVQAQAAVDAAQPPQFTPGQAQPAPVEPFNPMPPAQG